MNEWKAEEGWGRLKKKETKLNVNNENGERAYK